MSCAAETECKLGVDLRQTPLQILIEMLTKARERQEWALNKREMAMVPWKCVKD